MESGERLTEGLLRGGERLLVVCTSQDHCARVCHVLTKQQIGYRIVEVRVDPYVIEFANNLRDRIEVHVRERDYPAALECLSDLPPARPGAG